VRAQVVLHAHIGRVPLLHGSGLGPEIAGHFARLRIT
jgi:hypothetical protein